VTVGRILAPFTATAKQNDVAAAWADPTVGVVVADGAIRSGKTQAAGRLFLETAVAYPATYLVARSTYRSLKDSTQKAIRLHECRHTYVSLMHAAGCSLEEIGDYVGHSSTYMTDKYRHLLPGSHRDAARRLDALLAANV
jgi:integrase